MNAFFKLSFAMFGGFFIAVIPMRSGSLEAAEKKTEGLQISVSPVLPLDVDDPEITIHYCNSGHRRNLAFSLPKKEEILWFRQVDVTIDGKSPKYTERAGTLNPEIAHPIRSRWIVLEPKQSVKLRMKLRQLYVIPDSWQTIKIKADEIGHWEAEIIGSLILQKRRVRYGEGISLMHTSVRPARPFEPKDPEIVVVYSSTDESNQIKLLLPSQKKEEVAAFRNISVLVDGKEPEYAMQLGPQDDPKRSRFVSIEPQTSVKLKIRLKDIYKIPDGWKKIEAKATSIPGIPQPADLVGTLILERREKSDER